MAVWVDPHLKTPYPPTHHGEEARELLLRVLCGLESRLKGESEILGQFRQAFTAQSPALPTPLRRFLRDCLQRVREIRSDFLNHLPRVSYGSLVRRIIHRRAQQTARPGPVRVIGAGNLAKAILPHLKEFPVWLWARHPARAQALAEDTDLRFGYRPQVMENPHGPGAAVEVRCVPAPCGWGPAGPHTHIHFASRQNLPTFAIPGAISLTLEDLFQMGERDEAKNAAALERALLACRQIPAVALTP